MLYRTIPRNPPRLLLRVVATAGAVLVTSGCSSSSGGVRSDVPATGQDDAGYDASAAEPCCPGSAAMPPEDASIDGAPLSDAGDASALPSDAAPEDAAPEDAGGFCHPVCGIIVLVDP